MRQLLALLVILGSNCAQSAKILGIFPISAKSHYILGSSLMRALAEHGHDVTVISPFGESNPPKNCSYRDIVLTGFVEEHNRNYESLNVFGERSTSFSAMVYEISETHKFSLELTDNTLSYPSVQKLLNSHERFDLIVLEEFMLDGLKAIGAHYNAPLVLLSTFGANNWVNSVVGNPTFLSYVPDLMLGFSSKMSFFQRMVNVLMYLVQIGIANLHWFSKHDKLVKKYFPNCPDLNKIVYNTSLVLLNSHPSTNAPVPYVPTMIDIGGFHVKSPKQLPSELQSLLDNAKEGVIYFSLGSMAKSANLPPEKLQAFLKTFSKLKQKVLWKWEEGELSCKPANVYTAKWLPQQDILAHPNIKLFITHAGLLSTIETIYHGVPVLAVPIYGDQLLNAQELLTWGVGLKVPLHDVTEAALTDSINQILSNPTFSKNAKTRSRFYHDRLVHPRKTAVYWIEYVLRHGTSHLRVAGLDLPWYKYYILDVVGFVVIFSLLFLYLNIKIGKKIILLWLNKSVKKLKKV